MGGEAEESAGLFEGVGCLDLDVGVTGGENEGAVGGASGEGEAVDGAFGEFEADGGAVEPGDADGGVVDLDFQDGAGGDLLGDAGGEDLGHISGGVADEFGLGVSLGVEAGGGVDGVFGVDDEDADVVDDGAVSGHGLGGLDPDVFLEVGGDVEAHDVEDALGGDVEGLGHFEDEVGFADGPALGGWGGWRGQGEVAGGHFLVDPGHEDGSFSVGEAAVVGEGAVAGVGVPGGHESLVDDLVDGLGPAFGVIEGTEGEGGDLSGAVAGLAFFANDRGDVGGVSDGADIDWVGRFATASAFDPGDRAEEGAGGLGGADALDGAGDDGGEGLWNGSAGEDGGEGVGEEVALGGVLDGTSGVLVVDGAVVSDVAEGVEDDGLAGAFDSEAVGEAVFGVLGDGEVQVVLAGVVADVSGGFVGVGIDCEEGDAVGGEAVGQADQAGHVEVADGAVDAGEDEDEGLIVGEILAGDRLSIEGGELEVVETVADDLVVGWLGTGPGTEPERRDGETD